MVFAPHFSLQKNKTDICNPCCLAAALGVTAFRLRVSALAPSFGEVGVRSTAADLETAPVISHGHVEPGKQVGDLNQMFVCMGWGQVHGIIFVLSAIFPKQNL